MDEWKKVTTKIYKAISSVETEDLQEEIYKNQILYVLMKITKDVPTFLEDTDTLQLAHRNEIENSRFKK